MGLFAIPSWVLPHAGFLEQIPAWKFKNPVLEFCSVLHIPLCNIP